MPDEPAPEEQAPPARKRRPQGGLSDHGLDADRPRPHTAIRSARLANLRSVVAKKPRMTRKEGTGGSCVTLQSADKAVSYVLRGADGGLLCQRTTRRQVGVELMQAFRFGTAEAFDRWCEADPIRLADPHLWSQLLREGHDVLASTG